MSTLLSLLITMAAGIFLMWLNGRQHEFDQLQDKQH